jgi:hypothetical protein
MLNICCGAPAMAALGAAYAIFEQHQANLLGHAIKEVMPALPHYSFLSLCSSSTLYFER